MSTVKSIENAVEQLGQDQLAVFRDWFENYEASQWDAQIERDINAGKLDKLAEEAIAEFEEGSTRPL